MIRLVYPYALALLPMVVFAAWVRYRRAVRPTVLFSSLEGLRSLPVSLRQRVKRWLPLVEVMGLCCLVVALARPQWGRTDEAVERLGIAIQLVIDRSDSMNEVDLDPDPFDRRRVTRLDVVKAVVRDFIDDGGELPGRPHDLLGLVSFAGWVKVHCPLTGNHEILTGLLDDVRVPRVTRQEDRELLMTAMGDGLVMSVERMEEIPAKSKVIILLSDGRSNVGVATPDAGAADAEDAGVKVYTVGIGTPGRGLDEATLKSVAKRTGGRYFNARSARDVRAVYQQIDDLERSELLVGENTDWDDRFSWFLIVGVSFLVGHRMLADTFFRGLP